MLDFKQDAGSFSVTFNGIEILRHSTTQPCVEMGHSNGEIRPNKKHCAYYQVKERDLVMAPLVNFEVVETGSDYVRVNLEKVLALHFHIVSARLHIEISLLDAKFLGQPVNRFTLILPATKNEAVYGFGEQFSILNMRGRKLPLWTQEPGLGRDHHIPSHLADLYMGAGGAWHTTYYPQASFLSTRNYFMIVESYAYAELDFTNKTAHHLHFWEVPSRVIFDAKPSAPETLESLSEYLGRQPPIPDWAIDGMWLGIGGGLDPSKPWSVPSKLQRALDGNVKVSAIWSQDWSGLYPVDKFETRLFWNWEYDPERYRDLPAYIQKLNAKGIKFLGYNNCFLHKEGALYKEAASGGHLVKNRAGEPYDLPMRSFAAGLLDLTNPSTWEWIKGVVKRNMIDIGLSGWMCDFAEYLPMDCVLHSGADPLLYHNEYPVDWAKVNYEAVQEAGKFNGPDSIVFFSRSGNIGTSRVSPMIWGGDQMARFSKDNGPASVIAAGISLGLSGIGHFHYDIGGLFSIFFLTRTKEVFMRWTEMAAFTPVMRTHEGHQYEGGPNWTWDSDAETLAHFSKFSRIHSVLLPYTRHFLNEYQERGLPLIRHPYLHYESDALIHARKSQYQYLYGRDLFVAPVWKKNKRRWKVYLPRDNWVHLWSHEPNQGGWMTIEAPLGEPPVFFRADSEYESLFRELKEV